jgi:hypothetical protein
MTAPPGSEPVSPFLAFVGPQDRNPLRFGLWLTLGLPLALMGAIFVAAFAKALEPSGLVKGFEAPVGPHRLLAECRQLCVGSFYYLALALPFLGAARLAFQRPAWTFVSPARPFSVRLLVMGALAYAVLVAAVIGIDLLIRSRLAPPLLDASQPPTDRIVYVLALPPVLLMANAAQEVLFRGVFLQVSGAFVRTRIGLCVMNGLLSSVLVLPLMNPIIFLQSAVTGAIFAYAVLELGGIEFSVGAGFAGDFVECLIREPSLEVRTSAFNWADLVRPEVLISMGKLAAVAIGTALAVQLIKRARKA